MTSSLELTTSVIRYLKAEVSNFREIDMKAEEFFRAREDIAGECLLAVLVEARKVKAGEKIILGDSFLVQSRAQEDGWQTSVGSRYQFFNDEDFWSSHKRESVQGTKDIPAGAEIVPVKKGDRIFTRPWSDTDIGVAGTADADGFLVTLPEDGKPRFMSASTFNATFKTAAAGTSLPDQGTFREIPKPGAAVFRFVPVDRQTTFDFKEGLHTAEAGSFLIEDSEDPDGYTSMSAEYFSKLFLITKPAGAPGAKPSSAPELGQP